MHFGMRLCIQMVFLFYDKLGEHYGYESGHHLNNNISSDVMFYQDKVWF